jgi:PAS domain-containing protein
LFATGRLFLACRLEPKVTDLDSKIEPPENADLLRLIFESAMDFAVFAQDRSGNVINWNVGAERLTGFSADEIIGQDGRGPCGRRTRK